MKFSDIISLAKAGYTPADVREFLKVPEPETTPSQSPDLQPPSEIPSQNVVTEKPGTEPENVTNNDSVENVDYKRMYDELIQKQEELQKSLQAAQSSNVKQDASGDKEDPYSIFNKAAAEFM
jgi:hypothetical protein